MREKPKGMYPAVKQARRSLKKKTGGEQDQKQKEHLITVKYIYIYMEAFNLLLKLAAKNFRSLM